MTAIDDLDRDRAVSALRWFGKCLKGAKARALGP